MARVYQVMGNWEGAENATNQSYGSDAATVLDALNYGNGFDDLSSMKWLWGMPQTSDQNIDYTTTPHSFTDHYSDGCADAYVNEDFAALFSETDIRNLFDNTDGGDPEDYWYLTTTKFTFTFESDMPLMRTAEMILIEVEAKYWRSNEIDCHTLLYELQLNRDPEVIKSTNTGTDLLEEILVERRKELYAEIGVEWFDAKRLRRSLPRTGNQRLIDLDLIADDKKFFLKIPQKELDANDNINKSVNANR